MDLKYLVLLAALVYVCNAAKKAKIADPEKAKMLALQRQKLQYHKQKVLAPYNEGNGVMCAHRDGNKNKANTCIFVGSYCGFYCECPKCQCINPDHVGVEVDGKRECMPGNMDPIAHSYHQFNASDPDIPMAKTCRLSAQCKSNLECSPVGNTYKKYCICPLHMKWNNTLELCQPPDFAGDACDPTVGCGFGPHATFAGTVQTYTGHYCEQDNTTNSIYKCVECNVPHCSECSQGNHCSKCDNGYRLQKGTGRIDRTDPAAPANQATSDVCIECVAAYCKRCDSQTAQTYDSSAASGLGYSSDGQIGTCDECLDGYFKDSTNKYTCTRKVDYQRPCKGESEECSTEGAECRSVNGNKMCTCKAGYTWNPSGCFCVHPDADLNVEVNRTCKYDRKNFRNDDGYFSNDASLKVCKAGLECVDSCSPCAGCPGQTVCVTPIPYPEPPCTNEVVRSGGGSSGGSNNAGSGGSSGGGSGTPAGGSAGAGAGSGSEGGKSAGERTGTSLVALIGSLALARLFW